MIYSTYLPQTDFHDDDDASLREVNQLRDLTLMLLGRCGSQRNMIHTAYELPDKIDALAELITTTAALAALAVATDLSSQRIYEATRKLINHK
jgi:hypothetical protein